MDKIYFSNLRRLMIDRYTGFYIASNAPLESIEGLFIYDQNTPSDFWILKHNFSNPNYIIAVYILNADGTYSKAYPRIIKSDDGTINLDFSEILVNGYACVLFSKSDIAIPTPTPTITPTPTPSMSACTYYNWDNEFKYSFGQLFQSHNNYTFQQSGSIFAWVNGNLTCCNGIASADIPTQGFSGFNIQFAPYVNKIRLTVDITNASGAFDGPVLVLSNGTRFIASSVTDNIATYDLTSTETEELIVNAWAPMYADQFGYGYFLQVNSIEFCSFIGEPPLAS